MFGITNLRNNKPSNNEPHPTRRRESGLLIVVDCGQSNLLCTTSIKYHIIISGTILCLFIFSFTMTGWEKFVMTAIADWKAMNLQWTQSGKQCLPIFYEELENDTIQQVTHIVRFLNQTVDHLRIICATQEHPSSLVTGIYLGNHGLKTRVYLTTDPFSARMRQNIDQSIRIVNSSLFNNCKATIPPSYLKTNTIF